MVEAPTMDSGEKRLLELGYKQELRRSLSVISNFAFSYASLCVMAGITALFNVGLTYGGTSSLTWGWIVVGFFTLCVGLSMAEICSAFPTSGGLYFWSAQLAGPKWKPFASWITGWYNVVGLWAGTCGGNYALAVFIQIMVLLGTGGANGGGYILTRKQVVGVRAGLLISQGLLNCLPIRYVDYLGLFAVAWNVVRAFLLIIIIPAVAMERQSASFVFTSFNVPAELGLPSRPYVFLLGLLMSQFALAGFDASAQMVSASPHNLDTIFMDHSRKFPPSLDQLKFINTRQDCRLLTCSLFSLEDGRNEKSDRNGAYGIISSIIVSLVMGFAYILSLSFVVIDPAVLLDPSNDAGGLAVAQLFYQVFKDRYGSGAGGIWCLGVVAVAMYFGCMALVLSSSRMVYAFSRGGALPFSKFWHRLNRHEVPVNAAWLSCLMAFLMVLPSLGSTVAFQAMVSIATVGLYISYALPTHFRITVARNSFVPGPVNLGPRWASLTIGWVAVLWVVTISILFSLPVIYPVNDQTLNYTPVAEGGLFVLVVGTWLLYARKWFKGPHSNTDMSIRDDEKVAFA